MGSDEHKYELSDPTTSDVHAHDVSVMMRMLQSSLLAVTFDNKEKSCVKHTAVAQLLEQLLSAQLIDSTLQPPPPPPKGTPRQIVSIQSHLANMDDASA